MRTIPFSFVDPPLSAQTSSKNHTDKSAPDTFGTSDTILQNFPINLNHELIINPSATFLFRIQEHNNQTSEPTDFLSSDIIIVDQSLTPNLNDFILGVLSGKFVVQKLFHLNQESEIEVRGVVRSLIRVFR